MHRVKIPMKFSLSCQVAQSQKAAFDNCAVVSPAVTQRGGSLAAGGGIGKARTRAKDDVTCSVSYEIAPPLAPNCSLDAALLQILLIHFYSTRSQTSSIFPITAVPIICIFLSSNLTLNVDFVPIYSLLPDVPYSIFSV